MKQIAAVALMLHLGVAGIHAQQRHVRMNFQGTAGATAINLQVPGTNTAEYNFAGDGTLGSFTFRNITANGTSPEPSSSCSGPGKLYFSSLAGGGVLRFDDGSLLTVNLTAGFDCVDLVAFMAHCTRVFQITSGTGRFKDATGILTFNETLHPVSVNASGMPVFSSVTGEVTGAISGVAREDERHDEHR